MNIFSNKPESIYVLDQYEQRDNGKQYTMGAGYNYVPIYTEFETKESFMMEQASLINAVDSNTGQLVHSWLL